MAIVLHNSYILPLSIVNLLAQRLQTIEKGNHIIAVYPTKEEKFNEGFAFLRAGLERNEVVVITTTDLSKDEIRARMENEWQLFGCYECFGC